MSTEYEAEDRRVDDRRADDVRAEARLKEERRRLDRRHSDVLKTATFLEKIPQATWLAAMIELEIAAPETKASSGQMAFPFDDPEHADEAEVDRESNP